MKRNFVSAIAISSMLVFSAVQAEEQSHSGMMQPNMMKMAGPMVDVPVSLKEARVAFRIDKVAASGDNSFALQQIAVLSEKLRQMGPT